MISLSPTVIRQVIPPGDCLWSEIGPLWEALVAKTGEKSAFLSKPWVETWLEHFGQERRTTGLIWRLASGEVVGCALVTLGTGKLGPFTVSRAYLNASPGEGVGCEHNDVLALPACRPAVVEDLVAYWRTLKVDEVMLEGVRERLFHEVRSCWPGARWNGYRSESPFVDLETLRATESDFLNSLSANTRSQIRRSIRLYEKRFGEVTLELSSERDQRLEWLEALAALHAEVWIARGERGVFNDRALAFHQALIRRLSETTVAEMLTVDFVRVCAGGETIGMLYLLAVSGRVQFYQSGLAYDADRRLKPGLVTHYFSIESFARGGCIEYDFLGGEAQSVRYKTSLSTHDRSLYWARFPSPTAKMLLFAVLRRGRVLYQKLIPTTY